MKLKKHLFGCCAAALLMVLLPVTAGAGWFADLSAGLAYTQDADLTYATEDASETSNVSFDTAFTIDYRIGYWFEGLPNVGLAVDANYAGLEINSDQSIDVLSFTPLLMFQVGLGKNEKYPFGEWRPFVAGGPGIFITKMKYDVINSPVPDLVGSPTLTGEYEDSQNDIGLDLRAGVKKMMAPNWALNLEYRFFWVEPEYEDNVMGDVVRTSVDLYTHSFMVGASFNF